MAKDTVDLSFELVGDSFAHAWFFNRFKVERLGTGALVTFALVSETSGVLAVNAVMLGQEDLANNKARNMGYIKDLGMEIAENRHRFTFPSPPVRVYPVNNLSLARIGSTAEIGFYRFSINTLVDAVKATKAAKSSSKTSPVKCYPVVMFRCELEIQVALIMEILAL